MKEQSRGASNTNNKLSNQAALEIMQQQIKAHRKDNKKKRGQM